MNIKKVFSQAMVGILVLSGTFQAFTPISFASETKVQVVSFPESQNSNQSKTITIPKLDTVANVTVDHGDVSYSRNGESLTISVSNDTPTRQEWNSKKYSKVGNQSKTSNTNSFTDTISYVDGEGYSGTISKSGESVVVSGVYTPAVSKTVTQSQSNYINSFPSTMSYNQNGYSGTLSKSGSSTSVVESGAYTPADTIWVTNQTSPNYSQNGYSGTLSSYVASGSYTPAQSMTVYDQLTSTTNSFPYSVPYWADQYGGDLYKNGSSYVISGSPASSKFVSGIGLTSQGKNEIYVYNSTTREWSYSYSNTVAPWITQYYNYNQDGYTGQLNAVYSYRSAETVYPVPSNPVNGQQHVYRTYTNYYKYEGTVYKPDTRVWQQDYSGTVTKSAVDTRVWRYQGNVTKPASDTRVWKYTQQYSGTVTKPESDTRVWEQDYTGTVYKGGNEDYYSYNVTISYSTDEIAPDKPGYSVTANNNTFTTEGEQGSSLYYRIDRGEWVKYNGTVTLNDGNYLLDFKAVDQVKNESEISSVEVVLYRDALKTAVSYVEKAETLQTEESVNVALEKVDKIPHNAPEYQPLLDRLADIQALIDARNAIDKAIETRNEADVKNAQEKIDLLDSSNPIIIDLLDEVEADFEVADILSLIAKERYDILSSKYQMSKVAYNSLVQTYYAIKYTGDNMYEYASDKIVLVPSDDKYYGLAHEQYDLLNVDYDEFVEERVATDAEIKAESSVQVMEGKYDPTYAIHTQELINAVEDATVRTSLQQRLDTAKFKYEASLSDKATQSAIIAVEKAESTKNSYYVNEAYKKVNALTDGEQKTELLTRLKTLEEQIAYDRQVTDATRLVQMAEQYKSQYYIDLSQKKIDALPDGEDKTSLQQRLDVVKSGMATTDQATVIKNATNYVSLAQTMKTQYYVDKAQSYVNQITDQVKKAELQSKLDAIVVK